MCSTYLLTSLFTYFVDEAKGVFFHLTLTKDVVNFFRRRIDMVVSFFVTRRNFDKR